jgi:uncharacterized membrane protein (UPF0127 family)
LRPCLAFLAAAALAGAVACGLPAQSQPAPRQALPAEQPQSLPTERLTVHTSRGPATFRVQLALDDATREKGLMFVRAMPDDAGMIFDFHQPQPVSFWMKNTFIPLDLLFVAPDGRILTVASRARPHDESLIPSGGPIRAVIEINGGLAEKLGIQPGDRVVDEQVFPDRG